MSSLNAASSEILCSYLMGSRVLPSPFGPGVKLIDAFKPVDRGYEPKELGLSTPAPVMVYYGI
jgi:hypothetical protein